MTSDTRENATGDPLVPASGGGTAGADGPSAWQRRLAGFGLRRARTSGTLRERLVPPMPTWQPPAAPLWLYSMAQRISPRRQRQLSWAIPLLITALAGLVRFWNLGHPHAVIFDETYYAKDGWTIVHHGYATNWPSDANKLLLPTHGHQDISAESSGEYVVHPPLAKYLIGLGELLFGPGLTPFGWRFASAVVGTLSILMIIRIGRRLFRSLLIGCLAGVLLSVDGLHFVMSRTSLLDVFVMFWTVAAFGCLLIDRDKARARLAEKVGELPDPVRAATVRLGWRPWRIAAGVCLGAAAASKWNGIFVIAFFGVLTVVWDAGARRLAGARHPYLTALLKDALPAFASTVVMAVVVYFASWSGWFFTKGGYLRDWAVSHPHGNFTWVPGPLRSWWHYEYQVFQFNANLHSGHQYQSNPWSWLVDGRPVAFYWQAPKHGHSGCTASSCAREVLALGTPLLWWAAAVAVLYCLYRWFFRRDWRAGAVLCGLAAGYLPWFHYQDRTIFYFYAVIFVPFLCLALAMMLGAVLGPPGSTDNRRAVGAAACGVIVVAIIINFIYFYPIYTGQTIPYSAWQARMWLPTWI